MRVMELKPYDNCETATKNAVQMRMKWIVISIEKLHRNSVDMICCIYSQLSLVFKCKVSKKLCSVVISGEIHISQSSSESVSRSVNSGGGGGVQISNTLLVCYLYNVLIKIARIY